MIPVPLAFQCFLVAGMYFKYDTYRRQAAAETVKAVTVNQSGEFGWSKVIVQSGFIATERWDPYWSLLLLQTS